VERGVAHAFVVLVLEVKRDADKVEELREREASLFGVLSRRRVVLVAVEELTPQPIEELWSHPQPHMSV
jgi:hypothetical protein